MGPRATRMFLARHGEVESTWQGRIYGALDVPLSMRGREDGVRVARFLRDTELGAVVSSGLSRAEHMAGCLREPRRLERIDDPDFREIERGAWAGRIPSEVEGCWPGAWAAWFDRPSTSRPPGGESLGDLLTRVLPRVDHWARLHEGGSLAVITHGWVVRVLVCHVLGSSLDIAPRLDIRTGDIVAIRWSPDDGARNHELEAFAWGG